MWSVLDIRIYFRPIMILLLSSLSCEIWTFPFYLWYYLNISTPLHQNCFLDFNLLCQLRRTDLVLTSLSEFWHQAEWIPAGVGWVDVFPARLIMVCIFICHKSSNWCWCFGSAWLEKRFDLQSICMKRHVLPVRLWVGLTVGVNVSVNRCLSDPDNDFRSTR